MSGTQIRRGSMLQYSVQARISRVRLSVNSCFNTHCVCLFPTSRTDIDPTASLTHYGSKTGDRQSRVTKKRGCYQASPCPSPPTVVSLCISIAYEGGRLQWYNFNNLPALEYCARAVFEHSSLLLLVESKYHPYCSASYIRAQQGKQFIIIHHKSQQTLASPKGISLVKLNSAWFWAGLKII